MKERCPGAATGLDLAIGALAFFRVLVVGAFAVIVPLRSIRVVAA